MIKSRQQTEQGLFMKTPAAWVRTWVCGLHPRAVALSPVLSVGSFIHSRQGSCKAHQISCPCRKGFTWFRELSVKGATRRQQVGPETLFTRGPIWSKQYSGRRSGFFQESPSCESLGSFLSSATAQVDLRPCAYTAEVRAVYHQATHPSRWRLNEVQRRWRHPVMGHLGKGSCIRHQVR